MAIQEFIVSGRPVDGAEKTASPARWFFWRFKRFFDLCAAIVLLPLLGFWCLVLLALNPFFNRGPVFFEQIRMGRDCRAFKVLKFRSMRPEKQIRRGADDPLEHHRIGGFGRFLRQTRIDELPQIINVLRGDMSMIGPRPDFFSHARAYVRLIPGYRARYQIRPGISGLAQVHLGYAEGRDATSQKTQADLYYIRHAGFRLDCRLVFRTLHTIFCRAGA